jgi:hypothetical protein
MENAHPSLSTYENSWASKDLVAQFLGNRLAHAKRIAKAEAEAKADRAKGILPKVVIISSVCLVSYS